jgi:hypothetical protein
MAMAAMMAMMAMGCSSVAEEDRGSGGVGDGETHGAPTGDPWGGSAGGDQGSDSGPEDGDGTSGHEPPDTDGDRPPGGEAGMFGLCPELLPPSWVLCEDFEQIVDPAEVALDYQDLDGAFVLVDDVGASGHRSMEVTYRTGEQGAGWMVLSFGESPIDDGDRPSYAPGQSFSEIYWRLRVMTEPGWPDLGPGQLTRTISFASDDWTEAVVALLRSTPEDVTLEAVPVSCVEGGEVACNGYDDQAALQSLGPLVGETPLFAEDMSGQWHCVEGHLRLNTPGLADGQLEFWIDGDLQAKSVDLDLRGSWTEYGINALVVENLWPQGAPAPLRRWIDDVVISSTPIGCSDHPDDAAAG